ncbi:hypothetical protein B0H14DRAFT_3718410 [Mycena olivaceomarginata]|nr:hypothetical protein B0H14DRAFT_3718410 [Mycena olivaceomarginata]
MTESPGDSGSRGRPASYLHKACLNCRRRKIGCDGERPICRRCRVQPPRSLTPCTYSHTPVGGGVSPQLEEVMESMQNRIHELEHQLELLSGQDPSKVFLREPYSNRSNQPLQEQHLATGESESDTWDNPMQFFGTPSPIEVGSSNEPLELTEALIDIFLRHFSRHPFFFLDPTHFQQSALLPDIFPRGLLIAVALWASRVSTNPLADSRYSEEELLSRTVHHVARDVATGAASPQRILHMIQSEVLLSLYYLDSGRLSESNYHRAGATSLAFSAGLHQLGASAHNPTSAVQDARISVQMGAIPGTEMIDSFWSVLLINNYCVAASNTPSGIPCDTPISTPWPTVGSFNYLNPGLLNPPQHLPDGALFSVPFIDGDDVTGHSPLTLLVKASIQLERTMAFTARNPALPHSPEFWAIESRLDTFRGHLPPVDPARPTDHLSLVTHAFVNVAILRLHAPYIDLYTEARSKCLAAASCVAVRLADARLAEWEMTDPILGPLLAVVADVLIADLTHAGQKANTDLQTLLSTMQALARQSPLIQEYLTITQQRYTSAQENLGLFGLL